MMHWLWYTLPLIWFPGLERALGGPLPPLRDSLPFRRVIAVAAHPDDLEYFCGGTLGCLIRDGVHVAAVLATYGAAGGDPIQRAAEQEAAAAVLGYQGLYLLDFPDGKVQATDSLLHTALHRMIEQVRPEALLTFDPDHSFPVYQHRDHLAVARAALAVWQGPALLFHTRRPTLAFDITRSFDDKITAFAAHQSQLPRKATARLIGWHLGRRNLRGGRRFVEVFRER